MPPNVRKTTLISLLLLAACSAPPIDITLLSKGGAVKVGLSQDRGIFRADGPPCVHDAVLYRGVGTFADKVWMIEASGNVQCADDVESLTIGKTPEGFKEIKPLQEILTGRYTLQVYGIGGGEIVLDL